MSYDVLARTDRTPWPPGRNQGDDRAAASRAALGHERLPRAISQAAELGCADAAAVHHLITTTLVRLKPDASDLGALARYERPLPTLDEYDHLLRPEVAR